MAAGNFGAQANALFRKNLVYQKRSICSNICLVSTPIGFCIVLFILQYFINNFVFSGDDFKCGCLCLTCKQTINSTEIVGPLLPGQSYCPGTCEKKDESKCGPEYSSPDQLVWCPIMEPSTFPAFAQVPNETYRAKPASPEATILVTGVGQTAAEDYAAGLTAPAAVSTADNAALLGYLNATARKTTSVFSFDLSALSFITQWGTVSGAVGTYYLDPAISIGSVDSAQAIYAVVDSGSCAALGLTATQKISLLEYITKAGVDIASLAQIGGLAAGPSVAILASIPVQCTGQRVVFEASRTEINRRLYCGYYQARCEGGVSTTNQYTAAFDFRNSQPSTFDVGVYYNESVLIGDGQGPSPATRFPTLFSRAVNAWIKKHIGAAYATELAGLSSTPKQASKLKLDFSSLLGPLFYTWVVQLLLPLTLYQFVYEKEKGLRMIMKMHGLSDLAYWLNMLSWTFVLYLIYMAAFLIFGGAIGLNIFRLNSFAIQIIFYFLFGLNMVALAFLLSCFFTSAFTAVVCAFIYVLGSGLIGNLLLSELLNSGASFMIYVELVPAFALYRGLYELGEYAFLGNYKESMGMTWENLGDPDNGMVAVWIILLVETFVFGLLAWYLEQVFASGTGIRKHPLFFLRKCGVGKPKTLGGQHSVTVGDNEQPDVAEERMRIEELKDYSNTPIVVKELRKVYPGSDGQKPKLAVRTLTMGVENGECFGLLGPNGAGKSTSINMMVGFLEPSGGTAIINGKDIRRDMNKVYEVMGVCPQHDLQWATLTGREHLLFYGRLKGLKKQELYEAVEKGLRSVNLWNNGVADKQSRQYSGGMRRRLSVAISFMGDPRVVYLDEPSTGLDPASRRNLWDVVKSSKRNRAIILTTHSMEEAENLCDRLGIFVDGQLVCVGNPKEITTRYGGYLVFTITVSPEDEKAAVAMVTEMSPNSRLTYSLGGTLKFELPSTEVTLARVFAAMQEAKRTLRVLDWGVANATLEEVFIKFARQIGAKTSDEGHK